MAKDTAFVADETPGAGGLPFALLIKQQTLLTDQHFCPNIQFVDQST
jgi:hypothetical protein